MMNRSVSAPVPPIWIEGLEIFFDSPVTGVGLDSHRAASSFGKEAHNTGVSVLAETGIVGFLLALNVIRIVVARAWQRTRWARWYWRTQLAVVGLGAMFLSLEDNKAVWIFLALCVASAAAMRTQQARVDAVHPSTGAPLWRGGYGATR